jgi:hypothetical protein
LRDVKAPTRADEWLAALPEEGAVIEYPLHWTNIWKLYSSQQYARRSVNGTGYLIPSAYLSIENLPDLSRDQLELLWEHSHPRFVLVRSGIYQPDERNRVLASIAAQPDALIPRAQFGSEYVYELVDRGRGPGLYRHWPRGELEKYQALVFTASVVPGREDTTSELTVILNGRAMLAARGAGTEQPTEYRVPFTPADLPPGINTFEIRADYRLVDTAVPRAIGSTGVTLPADVVIEADRTVTTVQINGRPIGGSRGYLLVVLDPATGGIADIAFFDVSLDAGASDAMAAFIDRLPDGTPVAVASEYDVSRMLTARGVEALGRLGLAGDLRGQFQVMHAAVGVKGAAPGTAVEMIDRVSAHAQIGQLDRREVRIERLDLR